MRVAGHGLSVDAPAGWEARIFRRAGAGPVLHVATFALHPRDGDFGAAATGRMGADAVFAALLEYRGDARIRPGVGLFEPIGRPQPATHDFRADQLQVTRPGQYGWQRFYTEDARACCVYAVITPVRRPAARLVDELSRVLGSVRSGDGDHGG